MYAGATTVGVSLWPVDDESTAALMTNFYAQLLPKAVASSSALSSGSRTAALRASQLQLIDQRRYSSPFFWAPFILVGEPR